jgi:hypothetical protein
MTGDLSRLGQIVSAAAPLLGSALSLASPVAGVLVSLIAHVFGAKSDDINDIITKITQDGNSASKLKQLEMEHSTALYQAEVDDRKSAREREEAIVKLTGHRDWLLDFIALVVIAGYFIMCVFVVFGDITTQDQQILYMMLGQLTGGFIMVLSYYFGSSNKQ